MPRPASPRTSPAARTPDRGDPTTRPATDRPRPSPADPSLARSIGLHATSRAPRPLALALALGLAQLAGGCDADHDAAADREADGGKADDLAGAAQWESRVVLNLTATSVVEQVSYRVDGLRIFGQVCRPRDLGRHEVLVYAHGGFNGIADSLGITWGGGLCQTLADAGWVVLVSAYRGEDFSDGAIEVCLGEVDDVLEMTRIGLDQPYADPDRVALVGGSHGGCVGLRALQRGLPAQVAVDLFGPTDWTEVYRLWAATPSGAPHADFLAGAIGGTPEEVPELWAARSPIHALEALDAWPGALLVAHGTLDELVPVTGSCRLAAAAAGFAARHLDLLHRVVARGLPQCDGLGLTFTESPIPGDWTGDRHALFYDGGGHGLTIPIAPAMFDDGAAFLAAKLRGGE
jgi:acetyl esterase/lipase